MGRGLGNEYVGAFWFGSTNPRAWLSFNFELWGSGIIDTEILNAEAPLAGDTLRLESDIPFRTGSAVTWSLVDQGVGFPANSYAMLIGLSARTAGFGTMAGSGTTLLIDPASVLFQPSAWQMSGGIPSVTTPILPHLPRTVYVQAFGFNGGIGPGNAIEASNALKHSN